MMLTRLLKKKFIEKSSRAIFLRLCAMGTNQSLKFWLRVIPQGKDG
jgi:hypothetical protein